MATISLCMIVKNEENVLGRCLSSVANLMDEIVIIDTGSTDQTKEIARRYTDKIYDFPWQDDFSAARNFSFTKATMDYIYVADADEVLDHENYQRFAALKQILVPEIEIVQMKYITSTEFNTVMNIRNEYRPKLYKRLREFRWIDPIHETVQTQPLVFDSDIEILHYPQSQHSKRDFGVFLRAFNSGQPLSDKLHTMYARELYISGCEDDFLQAQPIFEQSLENDADSPQRLQESLCILSRCMRLKNNLHGFFKYTLHAMTYHPCAEICCELGSYFCQNDDFAEAARWFHCAAFETSSILDVHTSGDLPLSELAQCYIKLADSDPVNRDEYMQLAKTNQIAAANWQMPEETA